MTWLKQAFGLSLGVALLATACGKSSSGTDNSGTGGSSGSADTGGSGGDGGSATSGSGGGGTSGSAGEGSGGGDSISCGDVQCDGLSVGIPGAPSAEPCCIEDDEGNDACGLSTDVLNDFGAMLPAMCQPLDGAGEPDESCPITQEIEIPGTGLFFSFPGCCLPSGTCGYFLDSAAGVFQLGLGCVDASMFPEAPEPTSCSPSGGAGGTGGMGAGGQAGSP
jgi:hypothetical protein